MLAGVVAAQRRYGGRTARYGQQIGVADAIAVGRRQHRVEKVNAQLTDAGAARLHGDAARRAASPRARIAGIDKVRVVVVGGGAAR